MTPEELQRVRGIIKTGTGKTGSSLLNSQKQRSAIDVFNEIDNQPTSEQPKKIGIVEEVGTSLSKRASNIGKEIKTAVTGKPLGPLESLRTGLHIVGDVAGGVGDVVSGGIKGIAGAVIPEPIKKGLSTVGHSILNTDLGKAGLQALGQGMDAYNSFKEKNPEIAKDLESIVNIASVIPAGKAVQGTGRTVLGTVENVSKKGVKALETSLEKGATKKALNLIKPELSKAEKIIAVQKGLATQGKLGTIKIAPSPREIEIANEVKGIIKSKKPLKNLEEINNEVTRLADEVKEEVLKNPSIYKADKNEIKTILESAKNESGIVFGNDKPAYDAVINLMNSKIEKSGNTLSGLLEARKAFDSEIKSKFGQGIFGEAGDNARRNAIKDVRTKINDYISEKLPTDNVYKDSLKKQNLLLEASENVAQKTSKLVDKTVLDRANSFIRANPALSLAGAGGLTAGVITGVLTSPATLTALAIGGTYKIGKTIVTSRAFKNGLKNILSIAEKNVKLGITPKETVDALKQVIANYAILEGERKLTK